MEVTSLLISVASMGSLGALFSAGLAVANKKLYVEEDPRIVAVLEWLPGANCGGCGYPGCANFAENLVAGRVELSGCPVCDDDSRAEIAAILGIDATSGEKLIARVMCQGGNNEAALKAEYRGIENCTAALLLGGGDKLCEYGCLGFGDCIEACPFDAMYMGENGLPVVIEDKCTGCGKCAEACVRDVIEMHPVSHKLFVLCKNQDDPKTARKLCTRACIGCQICVRAVGENDMFMDGNLAVVNYDQYGRDPVLPTDKCPTKCLVILDTESTLAEDAASDTEPKSEHREAVPA